MKSTKRESIWLYHFTTLSNLENIFREGALLCKNQCSSFQIDDIAYGNIQDKRSKVEVPHPPYGYLHDYVPFYFAPRSPMMYVLTKTHKIGRRWPADQLIYLLTSVSQIEFYKLNFVFTDGHAIMKFTRFFDDVIHLDQVDWRVMRLKQWTNTVRDQDIERRRQAEFLINDRVPLKLIKGIVTNTQSAFEQVESLKIRFDVDKLQAKVGVKPDWYY